MPGFYENAGDPGNQFGTSAQASATEAKHWANYTEDLVVPEDGTEYSAKHYAAKASDSNTAAGVSAAAALASETAASASQGAAAASASNASLSETAAALSETNAGTSETNAAASAATASTAATNAGTSETNAAASAAAASTSASSASTSATNASASASAASTSAANASTSETNAAASAASAAASAATVPAYDTITGEALNFVRLNAGETSMEFRTPAEVLADIAAEPADATILKDADIGSTVQAYDSTLETGATKTSRKNAIINGNFDIWQRGTSFSNPSTESYTADRWKVSHNGAGSTRNFTRESFTLGQTDVPNSPSYYARYNISVAPTGSTIDYITQRIEDVRTFEGESVVLTFYAKVTTGTQAITPTLVQSFGTGGSPSSNVNHNNGTRTLTTSWQKFTVPISLTSLSGKTIGSDQNSSLDVRFSLPVNTAADYQFAQIQLEKGTVATEFERRTYGEELALCQRYYKRYTGQTVASTFMSGYNNTATQFRGVMHVGKMRAVPTLETTGTASDYEVRQFGTNQALTVVPTLGTFSDGVANIIGTSSGLNAGDGSAMKSAASDVYLAFNAEL